MSRVKVIQKQQGMIDMKNFGTRRKVDIDWKELDTFMTNVKVRSEENTTELHLPTLGEDAEVVWDENTPLPEELQNICELVRAVFSLKKEIKGFGVKIYSPADCVNPKCSTVVKRVPMERAMAVGARIIIPVGSTEVINIFVSTGKGGQSGSGKVRLHDSFGLMTPIGLAAGADFSWSDGSHGEEEPMRPGGRKLTFKKVPTRRYMIVIDCINDTSVLIQAVKDEAASASKGDATAAANIEAQLRSALDLNDVDAVAAAASAEVHTSVPPVALPVPDEVIACDDSTVDVDAIAAVAAKVEVKPDSPQASTDASVHQASTDASVHQALTDSSVPQASTDASVHQASTDSSVPQASTDASVPQASTDASVPQPEVPKTHERFVLSNGAEVPTPNSDFEIIS